MFARAGLGCNGGNRGRELYFPMLKVGHRLRRLEKNDFTKVLAAPLQSDCCMSGVHVTGRNRTIESRFIDYSTSVGSAEHPASFGNVRKDRVCHRICKELLQVRIRSLELFDRKVRFL